MDNQDVSTRRILMGGMITLAIALGISRFAYTPLLALMQQDLNFGDDFAGLLASANYTGYLAGALWAAWTSQDPQRLYRLRFNLALTILCTVCMGLTRDPLVWFGLRFVSGTTSAMVFVLASGLVLETLAHRGRHSWSGWLYAGVGSGIALSAILVVPLNLLGGWRAGWIGLAALCLIASWLSWNWIAQDNVTPDQPPANKVSNALVLPSSGLLAWLVVAYGLEGLGYIVTGTFLVTWLERSAEIGQAGFGAWFMVGIAAIPSCVLWMKAGLRFGLVQTLIAAHLVQAVGILLPLVSTSLWAMLAGAIFFGGTFLGITALSLVLGRCLAPHGSGKIVALLTASFGAGQMLGPIIAGYLVTQTHSTHLPLIGAAAVVAGGALLLAIGLACTQGAGFNSAGTSVNPIKRS